MAGMSKWREKIRHIQLIYMIVFTVLDDNANAPDGGDRSRSQKAAMDESMGGFDP